MKSPENRTLALLACFGIIAAIAIGWSVTRAITADRWENLATEGKRAKAEVSGFREVGDATKERVTLRMYYSFKGVSGRSYQGYTDIPHDVEDTLPDDSVPVPITYHPKSPDINAPVKHEDRMAAAIVRDLRVAAKVSGAIGAIALIILLGITKVNVWPRSRKR